MLCDLLPVIESMALLKGSVVAIDVVQSELTHVFKSIKNF